MAHLTACGEQKEGPVNNQKVTIECSVNELVFPAVGGEQTFNVSCDKEWTAYGEDQWVKCEVSGSTQKQGTVKVIVESNPETGNRNSAVVVKSGTTRVEIPLSQVEPLQVSKDKLYSSSKGEAFTVEVKGAEDWKAESTADWITAEKVDSKTLKITTSQNQDKKQSRSAEVKVSLGAEVVTITVTQTSAEDTDIVTPEGYHLVWNDEFNDPALELPDTKLWWYETAEPGWVNNELQTYIAGKKGDIVTADVSDGFLKIRAIKDGDRVYSARVNTVESWTYGYFEARLKLPRGKGTWPAFWMMPETWSGWPAGGEIDIMEHVGCVPTEVSSSIHCQAYYHAIGTQKTAAKKIDTVMDEFHVYALEWTPEYIKTYVDGVLLFNYNPDSYPKGRNEDTWPFNKPFQLKLNLAWGGDWGGMYGVDESCLPATYEIDYVRVFQKD